MAEAEGEDQYPLDELDFKIQREERVPTRQVIDKIDDVFALKILKGRAYGASKGVWYKVTFPERILNPTVVGVTRDRVKRAEKRQVEIIYGEGLKDKIKNKILDDLITWMNFLKPIPLLGDLQKAILDNLYAPMFAVLADAVAYCMVTYSYDPIMTILKDVVKGMIPDWLAFDLVDRWGLDRDMLMQTVVVRNVLESSFEWYSFGEMYIHWIALGKRPEGEKIIELPGKLRDRIDDHLNESHVIQELRREIEKLKEQINDLAGARYA